MCKTFNRILNKYTVEGEPMRKNTKKTELTTGDQPVMMQNLLTVTDVASILRLSRVKVYELMKRDGLPSLKINGARRIQPGKLKTWIEQHNE
jgi:excisionase family DNA binding protein